MRDVSDVVALPSVDATTSRPRPVIAETSKIIHAMEPRPLRAAELLI